jgi:hypothetical protein
MTVIINGSTGIDTVQDSVITSAKLASGQTLSVNGITFPASQVASADANTLDDYEEGTWTPTLSSSGTAPTVSTYTTRNGNYTKIGDRVTVNCQIRATITSVGTGTPRITGMPFTSSGLAGVSRGITNLFATQPSAMFSSSTYVEATGGVYSTVPDNYITFTVSYKVA